MSGNGIKLETGVTEWLVMGIKPFINVCNAKFSSKQRSHTVFFNFANKR